MGYSNKAPESHIPFLMGPPGLFAIHILTPPYFYKIATLCAAWDTFFRLKVDRVGGGGSSFPSEFTYLFPLFKIPHNSAFLLVSVPPCVSFTESTT